MGASTPTSWTGISSPGESEPSPPGPVETVPEAGGPESLREGLRGSLVVP